MQFAVLVANSAFATDVFEVATTKLTHSLKSSKELKAYTSAEV